MSTSKNDISYKPDLFLQSVIDGVPDCILVIGPDYEVKLMNRAAREFSLKCSGESEFQHCYKIFHQREKPCAGHNCPMEVVRKTGQPARVVHEHYNSNGEKRSVEILSSPLYGADGIFQGIIQCSRDITISRQAEKDLTATIAAIRGEKNKSEAIIAALGDGIIIQDTDYKIIYQNQVQNDIYGDRTGELCYRAYEGSDKICEDCPIEKTFMDGKIHTSERRVAKDKGDLYFELISSPLRDPDGKIIAGIKVVREISERKHAEKELRESEEKYRTLIENIQGGVFIVQDSKIQYINEEFAGMAGYEVEDIIGKDFREFIAPEYKELIEDYYSRRGAGENVPKEYEFGVLCKDGTKIYVNLNISLFNYHGKIASMGILRDITERKRAEEELRQSHNLLEAIKNAQSSFIEDSDKRMLFDNILKKLISLTQSEYGLIGEIFYNAEGNPYLKITHAITNITSNKDIQKVIEIKAPLGKEFNNLKTLFGQVIISGKPLISNNPSGEEWKGEVPEGHPPLNSCMVLPFYQGNKFVGIAGIANRPGGYDEELVHYLQPLLNTCANIIEAYKNNQKRKQAEDELRESERFMDSIFASIQDGIGIIDSEMNIIKANKTAECWYPYAVPFIGKKCYEAYHNRKKRCDQCPAQETLVTGNSTHMIVPKHGPGGKEVGWLEIYCYPLKDTITGQMKGVIEYVRDITERKLVEEELRQSEEKYRLLIESIQEGVFVIQDAKIQFVNEPFAKITGYRIEEIIGMDFSHFVAPEDLKMVQDRYSQRQKGEDVPREYEIHGLRKDGGKNIINMNVGIVTYRGRIASMGILKDITAQKHAEKLIKESEEKYRNIVELTTDMIYISDKNGNMVFLNDAGYRILEAIPEEVIGDQCSKWVYPEDRDRSFKKFTEMISDCTDVFEFENRYISKNGKVTSLLHNVKVMKNENGDVAGIQGIARDITERKKVEERLRLFSEAVENAPDGVQITDLQSRIIYSNNVVEEIYGFSNEELKGKNVNEMNVDLRFAEMVIIPSIKNSGRWKGELMVKHKKGFEFPIWLTTSMVKDKKGSPIAMVGIIRDITERKMVEKALIESETRYRTLFESAGDAIFILEAEGEEKGRIVAANRTAAQMHGYSIDELLTLNIVNLDTPESSRYAPDFIRRILNGETIKAELDHCRKDGTVFPIEIIARLLELGAHKYILAFDRDITDRKRAQEALRLSNLVVENSQTVLFRWKAQEGWPVEYVSNNVVQFGYNPEEFLSGALPYASIIHPEDMDRVSKEVQGYQWYDDRFAHEYRIIARNGAIHWIEDRMAIERNRDGQITHYQGIIIDITERKYIEEAIKKYNMELEESNRIKELFTDIMHHDLLNPLNVAHGYVELFLEDETNHQKKSYLETIKRNLVKGMELIENASKFSKLESMDHIEFEDLDLKMVIREVIENITPLALRAGMSIENNLKGRMPARANKIIEDIFINLISNAIKYAPEGKRIVVDGKDHGNFWIIRVVDFGPGIKDADKKSIFERFQSQREEKKGVKGSGLGLAIAGKIVNLHKGRIWVEDNPEGGALFAVEIPK